MHRAIVLEVHVRRRLCSCFCQNDISSLCIICKFVSDRYPRLNGGVLFDGVLLRKNTFNMSTYDDPKMDGQTKPAKRVPEELRQGYAQIPVLECIHTKWVSVPSIT